MYKCYLLKYFGTFTLLIDHAVIEFQKHWLINYGNTKALDIWLDCQPSSIFLECRTAIYGHFHRVT